MKNKVLTVVLIVALGLSLVFNAHYFVYRPLQQRAFERGLNTALNAIINQAQQTGKVEIRTDAGSITLIADPNGAK